MNSETQLVPVMNNTKWEELRSAFYALGSEAPSWRTKIRGTGHVSEWDREWFYHFRDGGYQDLEWVELQIGSEQQALEVRSILAKIHVPIGSIENGFRVYGFIQPGQAIDYATP